MTTQRTSRGLVAHASVQIAAPAATVWNGLIDPAVIKQYMFGAAVECDWHEGSALVLRGEWEGKPFEDKGVVLEVEPNRRLTYTYFSPLSGAPDVPENYHTITVELTDEDDHTNVALSQDNNATEEERDSSATMWSTMLTTLKDVLEA